MKKDIFFKYFSCNKTNFTEILIFSSYFFLSFSLHFYAILTISPYMSFILSLVTYNHGHGLSCISIHFQIMLCSALCKYASISIRVLILSKLLYLIRSTFLYFNTFMKCELQFPTIFLFALLAFHCTYFVHAPRFSTLSHDITEF